MARVTADMGISLDGYAAGPNQTFEKPFGDGGLLEHLSKWMFDEDEAPKHATERAKITSAAAYVMGRNMFGPGRGAWDLDWRGWWGEDPPYHTPVYVLTNHEREPLAMDGGTTFHFVTDGIESALEQARAAAGDKDVSIAGGASTVRQYLAAGLLDELYLHIVPVVLGAGERLLDGVGDPKLEPVKVVDSPTVTHVKYRVVR